MLMDYDDKWCSSPQAENTKHEEVMPVPRLDASNALSTLDVTKWRTVCGVEFSRPSCLEFIILIPRENKRSTDRVE